jgi:crotonobetainyl-CoA:carnitine CoA-transferase CaiB-like acyl-CoA transferase
MARAVRCGAGFVRHGRAELHPTDEYQTRDRCGAGRLGRTKSASVGAETLRSAGIPAAALARSSDLVQSAHLAARAFWDRHGAGVLPGLPWRASFGRTTGPAPGLGADTDQVLADVLGLSSERIVALRANGVLG